MEEFNGGEIMSTNDQDGYEDACVRLAKAALGRNVKHYGTPAYEDAGAEYAKWAAVVEAFHVVQTDTYRRLADVALAICESRKLARSMPYCSVEQTAQYQHERMLEEYYEAFVLLRSTGYLPKYWSR